MKKKIFNAAVLISWAAVCVSCGSDAPSLKEKLRGGNWSPEPVTVGVRAVEQVRNGSERTYVGRVEASQNVVVSAQFPGRVESIDAKKGRNVKAGDVVAVLKSESVESAYDMAKATLEQAQDGYDRMMRLYPNGGVTEVKKMEVQTQLRKAEASFAAAESALEKCSIKAPCSGVVEKVFIEQGEEIALSAPILRIMNVGSVEIHIPVPENEISSVMIGEHAHVYVSACGTEFDARVTVKGVDAAPLSHSYECVLVPESACGGLLPGMVCNVSLSSDGDSAFVVPMRCVLTDNEGRYVWCSDADGLISKRRIVCGGFSSEGVIVLEGLAEGDLLVVEGHRKVSSGMKVKLEMI